MRDLEFDDWLASGTAKSAKGRQTRRSAIKRIERNLEALGFIEDDLDRLHTLDRFAALISRLEAMVIDRKANGEDFRILFPESNDPDNRLTKHISWLKQYGRFLSGEPSPGGSDADVIRAYVIEEYIEPAREAGQSEVAVQVRAIDDAVGGKGHFRNVFQALVGAEMQRLAGVPKPIVDGRPDSPPTMIHFKLSGPAELDADALNRLKRRFMAAFPDFERFDRPSNFSAREDDTKKALVARASEITARNDADETTGAELLDLLIGRGGLTGNLIHRGMVHGLRKARERHPGVIERAAGELARAQDPVAGIDAFLNVSWPLLSEGQEKSLPYGDSRTIPTMLAALIWPNEVMGILTQQLRFLYTELSLGAPFTDARLTPKELRDVTAFVQSLLANMNDWGWGPRDLWDVQGFIATVACDDDATVLAKFDANADFRAIRAGWSAQQKSAFCRIARAVHDAGLDWWFVGIAGHPLRFGRKSLNRTKAEGVLGDVGGVPLSIHFNRKGNAVDIGLPDDLTLSQAATIEEALVKHEASILGWLRPTPLRAGHWPERQNMEALDGADADESHSEEIRLMHPSEPTNLILYGPPGTGKTFKTAEQAVRLCGLEPAGDRMTLMDQYRALESEGRIRFVTFHQSFGYEDFVEGLRPIPITDEAGGSTGFTLEPQDGVFKKIAQAAAGNRGRPVTGGAPLIDRTRTIFKMSLGRSWASEDDAIYESAIRDGYVTLGWGGEIDWSDPRYDAFDAVKHRWREIEPDATGNNPNIAQLWNFRANMKVGSLVVISDGNRKFRAIGEVTSPYQFRPGREGYNHRRDVKWLWHGDESLPADRIYEKSLSQVSAYQLNSRLIHWDALGQIVAGGGEVVETTGEPEPYVLIIDEINRGNMSKIFGELITLIEPDKRLGAANALTVTLPYSQKSFAVPSNLHILGTMNTADRSIALLDTALRRRFQFRELAPEPSTLRTIDGIDLPAVLRTINQRIEYLIDREHRIGHAFFIGCTSRAAIDTAMRDKVIPLLQEYFFEDWSRIHAVIGSGFIGSAKLNPPPGFDEPRTSWFVRTPFADNAYARLISGAETSEDEAEPA